MLLRLFGISNLRQHAADEREQFVDGVKSHGLVRGDVLDLALHPPGFDIGRLSKLDHERRLGLPSLHCRTTIVRARELSHNAAVRFGLGRGKGPERDKGARSGRRGARIARREEGECRVHLTDE